MKKIRNIIFTFALLLASIFVVSEVNATTPSSFGLSESGLINKNGSVVSGYGSADPIYFAYKYTKDSNNYLIFCTSDRTAPADVTATFNRNNAGWNEKTRAGIAYILENSVGLTAKKSHGISESTIFVAQMSIWKYLEETGVYPNNSLDYTVESMKRNKPDLYNRMNTLVTGAKNYANSIATSSFSISLNSSNLTFTKSGDYYISNAIKVSGTSLNAGTIKVEASSAPTGTQVTGNNTNGYVVKVPVSSVKEGTTKISVKATASSNQYYLASNYKSSTGVGQSVTLTLVDYVVQNDDVTASGSITVKPEEPKKEETSFKVKKITLSDGKYTLLSGATLQILDKDGKVAKDSSGKALKWTTTDKAYTVTGLPAGKYTLKETVAPNGYSLSKEIPFTLKADGTITCKNLESALGILDKDSLTIVMVNNLTKTTFSKQDATTGKELPGATLQVLDKDGKELYKWVSTDTPHIIEGLPVGKYYLKETVAPNGYVLSEEMVEFEVKSDGTVTNVVMTNEPEKIPEKIIEVPNTGSKRSILLIISGILLSVVGTGIIGYTITQNKKNSEI